jgi:hypothetical protein
MPCFLPSRSRAAKHDIRSARNASRLSPLNVRSERSPLHDVRQHARRHDTLDGAYALTRILIFTDEQLGRARLRQSFGGQPSHYLACQPKLRNSEGWWSQTGSNRRPPACKAGALPTELWPQVGERPPTLKLRRATFAFRRLACQPKLRSSEGWWAWEDLNFRPHAYQARALTN